MAVTTGLEGLARSGFKAIQGKRIALLCNQASVTSDLTHAIDLLLPGHKEGRYCIDRVFGPQHGLWGHTQDNMIEWEGARDPRTGLVVSSLYGERRAPTDEQLREVELFVIDLQDVGARYYTFIWTMALCMEACGRLGVPMLVLDRPNPIGGSVEGPVMEPRLASFVGLHPLPARHGMTIGEIASHFQKEFYPSLQLEIGRMEGWERAMFFEDTGLPWVPPSPNVPTPDTAMVYPGMCLLEGTNVSEGRGTTRPFEQFGAPWLDGWVLADRLNAQLSILNALFRPVEFEPTSGKFARQRCGGCFIHVLDRASFRPVLTGLALLRECSRAPQFAWKDPPYEYEFEKRPIDLLLGVEGLAERVLSDEPLELLNADIEGEATRFAQVRADCLIY